MASSNKRRSAAADLGGGSLEGVDGEAGEGAIALHSHTPKSMNAVP